KTHKEGSPFRVIVEDKGTWQHVIARELQKFLSLLQVDDPFLVRNSDEVVEFLNGTQPINAFSVDVKDMFYNVPQQGALEAVEECVDVYGSVKFQNQSGISTSAFLDLFRTYLSSLHV
ncbi:hypothetical protein HPB47_017055, partial [Ixodes persulcatus]